MSDLLELRNASSIGPKNGVVAWWREAGCPPFIMITDPPYFRVRSFVRGRTEGSKETTREIRYGSLSANLRKGIAVMASEAEWSAIYGLVDDMGAWRKSIESCGGCWLPAPKPTRCCGAARRHTPCSGGVSW